MINKNITNKITQGMYVLTTIGGGCIVDSVSQISAGDNPLISVAVNHKNKTNELLKQNNKFALSILGMQVNPEIIKIFGFNSTRDIDKFQNVDLKKIDNINIISNSIGYMLCEIVDFMENDTHTLFIGKLIKSDIIEEDAPMSYNYYQEHKEELLKVTTKEGKTYFICTVCGYIYEGDELPYDFKCPVCGVGKELFQKKTRH